MKQRIRKDDFNPMWSALRLPGSGWVSELLTGYLAASNTGKPRKRPYPIITQGREAGSHRPVIPYRSKQLQACECSTVANCC